MPIQKSPASKSENLLINRRRFLINSGAGAVGVVFFTLGSAKASPVFTAVGRFAAAVGAAAVASKVTSYIELEIIPKHTALEVVKSNCRTDETSEDKFLDFSQSKVYAPVLEKTYFFYPVRNIDGFNAYVSFFDRKRPRGTQFIGVIGGPTLFGISELAVQVAKKQSNAIAKRVFLPREIISTTSVRLDRSSNEPDIYQTEAGRVESVYRTNGNGRGEVRVEARNEGGTLLAGGTYDLTYTTA